MTGPSPTCAVCGTTLAADQRYCLACGTRIDHAAPDARELLARDPDPAPPAAAPVAAAAGTRLAILPGREVSLTAVFALVLGLAAWAGAATMRPGEPTPVTLAASGAAPAEVTPATPIAPATSDATALGDVPPADATASDALASTPPDTTTDPTVADTSGTTGGDSTTTDTTTPTGDSTQPGGDDTQSADAPQTPDLKHVWLIVLADRGSDTLFDPAGAASYLNRTLVPKGALLTHYFGVTSGALANGIALVSGQGPNAATQANCPSFADLAPGTLGKDDQAAGDGCGYSTDVFSVADLVAAQGKSWRAYAGALDATDGAAAPATCPKPAAGAAFPLARMPFLAFHTIIDDPSCAERIVGLDRLAGDLKSAKDAPAFSYLVPSDCESGSDTPCRDGAPAGLGPADGFLKRVVPQIQASPAYKDGGAIVILADQAPGGDGADRSSCCTDRSWYGADPGTDGGGRTGALVLSPLVKGRTSVDDPVDHYDLLKTVAQGLGVTPPGYAARKQVTGLPGPSGAPGGPRRRAPARRA